MKNRSRIRHYHHLLFRSRFNRTLITKIKRKMKSRKN